MTALMVATVSKTYLLFPSFFKWLKCMSSLFLSMSIFAVDHTAMAPPMNPRAAMILETSPE